MGISEIWTIIAVVLHCCGVGDFANWPIIAGPFTWSCMCIEIWVFLLYGIALLICLLCAIFCSKK